MYWLALGGFYLLSVKVFPCAIITSISANHVNASLCLLLLQEPGNHL
tara:strand:- start:673 stop:813 length:141 start_codon:yes stop_codon:yes gene_type:complete